MELRIGTNNRRKQFAGIGRDHLCDFEYGVKYQFPYSVRYRQLESVAGNITEECPKSFVGLKPLHRAKYVVLHHRQRKTGNLSREVYALALAEVEQLLLVVICHLGSPSHGVGTVCLEEAEREVRGEQPVPLSLPPKERSAITLFYLNGYNIKEIAAITDTSEDAVKKQLSRGRDKLKEKLKL